MEYGGKEGEVKIAINLPASLVRVSCGFPGKACWNEVISWEGKIPVIHWRCRVCACVPTVMLMCGDHERKSSVLLYHLYHLLL